MGVGDCRERVREYAPVLVTEKVPEEKVARNRRPGLLSPDYSEKIQSHRTSASFVGVKVDNCTRTVGQGSVQETEVCNLTGCL